MASNPFDFAPSLKRYAVMGNPVTHSKSPQIHQQFACQCALKLEYGKIQVDPGGFEQAVDHFFAVGGDGLNITVPYKLEAFRLSDELSARAAAAGAVNTLKLLKDKRVFGDNTDGAGLITDITQNWRLTLAGKKILILGAGGAVRGIVAPLAALQPTLLLIANRTADKARELAALFSGDERVRASGLDFTARDFDLVINGTAASLEGAVPALPTTNLFSRHALAYDLMYANEPTAFMRWAQAHGAAKVTDGLGMLVEQAAESFFIWHGQHPQTAPVIAALRHPPR